MAKIDLIPKSDVAFAAQLQMFQQNIGTYAANLGVTAEQIAAQSADADYFRYVVQSQQMVLTHSQACTVLRKIARKGDPTITDPEAKPGPNTLAITLPAAVPPVAFGIEGRFRLLVRQVKASVNYTVGIGVRLGIEAKDHAAPDQTTLQPKLAAKASGDHVELSWGWQGWRKFLDLCVIEVDRGDGKGFVWLASSVKTSYKDLTPFPAGPTRWTYRACYHAGDKQIGNWSLTVTVLVGVG